MSTGNLILDELKKNNEKLDLNNNKLDKLQTTMDKIEANTKTSGTP